jgi:type IV pilus assembly protein PilB
LQIIADHLGTEVIQIQEKDLTPEVLQILPANTARMYQCLPVALFNGTVRVALGDPLNPSIVDELGFITRRDVQLVVADRGEIEKAISKFYGDSNESVTDILKELGADGDIAKEAEAHSAVSDRVVSRRTNSREAARVDPAH